MIEKRRYNRASIDLPVSFTVKGDEHAEHGIGKDISIGGIFIQTVAPATFGAEVVVHVTLEAASGHAEAFALPGVVRWIRDRGMGVQFGLLGVQETHAITELEKLTPQ